MHWQGNWYGGECFSEVDIAGKVTIKQKLLEIVCPAMTSMVAPMQKF